MESKTRPQFSIKRSIPETKTYQMTYVAGFVLAILLFGVSLVIAHKHELTGVSLGLFRWFNNWPNGMTTPANWLSEGLGAGYPIALCVLIPLLWKRFKLAWRFLVAVGATGVLMEIGKIIAKEPRPVVLLAGNLHQRAVETGLTSFPSGHVAVATAMAMTMWLILPRAWRWVSVVWVLIVAVSRLYLGVHQPIDIVGGFAMGLLVCSAIELLPLGLAKFLHLDDERLTAPGF